MNQRVLDGRKSDGEYQSDLIEWFDAHGVDTRLVAVDSIKQRTVTNRKGEVLRYRVIWKQARLNNKGEYVRRLNGDLALTDHARIVPEPLLR